MLQGYVGVPLENGVSSNIFPRPVEELHPDLNDPHRRFHPRVLCGNRLALWRLLSETEELPKERLGGSENDDKDIKKSLKNQELQPLPRWWFQTFFIFTPIWGRFPI